MRRNEKIALNIMTLTTAAVLAIVGAFVVPKVALSQEGLSYEVIVTNLTRGQQFTPILAATHGEMTSLFTLGSPSTPELATLA